MIFWTCYIATNQCRLNLLVVIIGPHKWFCQTTNPYTKFYWLSKSVTLYDVSEAQNQYKVVKFACLCHTDQLLRHSYLAALYSHIAVICMVTSWNGNIFCVSGPLCGEFTGDPHKGQWRGALMFSLIHARINSWVNNREAGDLRRHRTHYDVIVMDTDDSSAWHSDVLTWKRYPHCRHFVERIHRSSIDTPYKWPVFGAVWFTLLSDISDKHVNK